MSSMNIKQSQLVNLEQSLKKEFLRSNRSGAFASSSLVYCNTRKHHGLLICPVDEQARENHVLLSALDETIIQEGQEFHLGIHRYPGSYHPLGHKYIEELSSDPVPNILYRIGGVVLKKEGLLVEDEDQVLFRYTVVDCVLPVAIRFQPFLAFRDIHALTRANLSANTKYEAIPNGIKTRMYEPYPFLHMQLSAKNDYTHAPSWFYNIEYNEDREAGESFQEDLFVPGYLEVTLKKGESVVFSASTVENVPGTLKRKFNAEVKKRTPRNTYENCLINAAQQFICARNGRTDIIAGYPYFGASGRDSFLSLPGLTLYLDQNEKAFFAALDGLVSDIKGDIFTDLGNYRGKRAADTPLWMFWTLQQYVKYKGNATGLWKRYGATLELILNIYLDSKDQYIKVHENGLIYADQPGMPLTWMDVVVDNEAITPRSGYAVEINALWYNAINFFLELAPKNKVNTLSEKWSPVLHKIKGSFNHVFWSDEKGYLADHVNHETVWSVRPNMLFAVSLPYSVLNKEQKLSILETVRNHLYTKKGLRTLSPRHSKYTGFPSDNKKEARRVYHQGNIFPWLTGHFFEAEFELKGKIALQPALAFYNEFEKEMTRKGMGVVSEYFFANPPHDGRGAISQAWNTAELIRIKALIGKYEK